MITRFYTLDELYNSTNIDDDFISTYNKLYPAAQKNILEHNSALWEYLYGVRESSYDKLDFTKKRIDVEKVFLRYYIGNPNKCPVHDRELKDMQVTIKIGRGMRSIKGSACEVCKRLYTTDKTESVRVLEKLEMPYKIIEETESNEDKV